MKKITLSILSCFFALSLILSGVGQSFAADAIESDKYIESVNMFLPDIDVYVNGFSSIDNATVSATLDGESLQFVGSELYDPASINTCIYVLADVSGSVSQSMFHTIASAVKNLLAEQTAVQTIKFYTFSQDTVCILDGSESYEDACDKLDNVRVTGNGYTALYDALYLIHDAAAGEKSKYDRQMVLIFTDGENEDNKAKRTADETKALYRTLDLPVYAMCMSSASEYAKQTLGEIARLSGGTNRIYNTNNINDRFDELTQSAFSCYRLRFQKKNNKAGDKDKNLSVSINGAQLPAVTVYESAVRIKDDTIPPTYTVSYDKAQGCMIIQYSEHVLNADQTGSYIIIASNGKVVPVDSVKYDEATQTAYLYFAGRFYSDSYTVSLAGVTDDSFAANKPQSDVEVTIKADSVSLKILDYWWILLIPLCIAIIVLIVVLILKRKRKINNVKELFEVENESNYEVRHHIVNAPKGRPIILNISTGRINNQIKTNITSSLIFGRSDACDICIDDAKLSRQHFALESGSNGELYVLDLNSTNGTFVNSQKLTAKIMISPSDEISAGLTKIRVQF